MKLDITATPNQLVTALPEPHRQRWLGLLEQVNLPQGSVLCEPGHSPSHVYFPTTAIVSLLHVLRDGRSTEIAMVGREGIVGIGSYMGGESMPHRSVVLSAGSGCRMRLSVMHEEFERHSAVRQLVLRYTQALMTQLSQTAVCNRHHSVDQRVSRCLLHSLDRLRGNELAMTHATLARVLGVRRSGVTDATLKLQAAGLIRYLPGCITVVDRRGLELRSCECHAIVRDEYRRLLPSSISARSERTPSRQTRGELSNSRAALALL
jgi:CRP-like cAMP-binding protein